MPAFIVQNGPRIYIPLKSQAKKRTLSSSNVFDGVGGEKKARPLQNGAVHTEQTLQNGNGVVGPLSMQERLRLAESSAEPGPSGGHLNGDGGKRLLENSGAVLANEGEKHSAGGGREEPIEISMLANFPGPGVGLGNLGNTCYLNSVLQCLLHTPPLHNLLEERHHSKYCEYGGRKVEGFCPLCLLECRLKVSFQDGQAQRFAQPLRIAKNLHHFSPQLRIGEQEDAHELLRLMIDSCHRTCLLQQRGSPLTALKRFEDRTGKVPTVISDIFGGVLRSQVKCLSCGGESNKCDVFMDLSLDLGPSTTSVNAALQGFVQPEKLDGSNKYRCEKCKRLSPARKQMQVLRAPNVLVIQLKRFENICGGKITRHIHISETLSLGGVMAPSCRDPPPEYTLYALIVHEGSTQQSGHYYAYAKVHPTWYLFNDSTVRAASWGEVSRQGAYILFYMKTRPRGAVFFYPPRSQGEGHGSKGDLGAQKAGPVYGPQLPPNHRGPVNSPASAGTVEVGDPKSSAGPPFYGPQLPLDYRGLAELSASPKRVQTEAERSTTALPTGPVYGPQLPPHYQAPISPPSSYQGPLEPPTRVETMGTEAGSSAAAPQPGPVYGPQLPSGIPGGFFERVNENVEVASSSRESDSAPQVPEGPVNAAAAPKESGNRGKVCSSLVVPPPEIPPQGSASQAVTVKSNPGGPPVRTAESIGRDLRVDDSIEGVSSRQGQEAVLADGIPGRNLPGFESKRDRVDLAKGRSEVEGGPICKSIDESGNADENAELVTGRIAQPFAEAESVSQTTVGCEKERLEAEIVTGSRGQSLTTAQSVNESGSGVEGVRGHNLKRRLSEAHASEAPEPKRRASESIGRSCSGGKDLGEGLAPTELGHTAAQGGGQSEELIHIGPRGGVGRFADVRAALKEVGAPAVGITGQLERSALEGMNDDSRMEHPITGEHAEGSMGVERDAGHFGQGKSPDDDLISRCLVGERPSGTDAERGPKGLDGPRVAGCGREERAGGKVELLVEASAWSLAYSYGSDEDEECEEMLRRGAKTDSCHSPCNGLVSKDKQLPGLIEAESLLQKGAGHCVFVGGLGDKP